jgi:hypothetical protein
MKVLHFVMFNTSGMFRVAESMVLNEKKIGLDSYLCDFARPDDYLMHLDADILVSHTHVPDSFKDKMAKSYKLVWVAHGVVEHAFQSSVENGLNKGYGAGDTWMLCQWSLQNSDASVTFWPRQQAIWKSLCDKKTEVHLVPLGVEKDFWHPVESRGKYLGNPSLFTAENCHYCKWPLDLFIAWPWVWPNIPNSHLHAIYIPNDQHRWFFPLVNRNGAAYRSTLSGIKFEHSELRNAFCSTDYFIGLVRYGEANRLFLEATASGAKTISYWGNTYADYWIHEGDQREMAKELVAILKGEVEPRKKDEVPDAIETAKVMKEIYENL